ncbi:MAG: tRNA-uridine aminocarboxypropyltransferase [Nannocystaceae bacterium]|nr:DTW domain-containing protein [bacterium]
MAQRNRKKPRCWGCGLKPEICACELMPTVELNTPIRIVQQIRERSKPTNTARLFATMVPATPILPFGMREPPFDETPLLDPDVEFYNLFLRDDATPIDDLPEPAPGKRRGFVVLDGTWHQCSRMARRVPVVRDLPCVMLPPGKPSIWRVRTQHDPRGVSTFEATVRLLEIVEGPDTVRPLVEAFEVITARLLHLKGKLKSPEVPEDWDAALAEAAQRP